MKKRKKEINKILTSKRFSLKEEKQKKIEHFFAFEVPEDIQMDQETENNHQEEVEQEEEIKERGKLDLNQHFKKGFEKTRKSAGIANQNST